MRRFDMKGDWDARARANAGSAIVGDKGLDVATFRESGKRDLELILKGVLPLLRDHKAALEIGCGTGRLLEALIGCFDDLHGVDVSGEMVRRGRERLNEISHVHLTEIDGRGKLPFEEGSFDLCFAYITFHHIPEKSVVRRYVREANRVLKTQGVFRFHLFGRPEGVLQTIREKVTRKSTWRGCKFTISEAVAMTREAGFNVVEANYISAEGRPRFFGKTPPDAIWITAVKPATEAPS
jgi:SAM-dependent methyltransferase